jgi:chemotaxis protein histidine kinase CheA
MSEGPGFLEFFILEASDYVEQLDGLLLGGSSTGPDADALQRVARALRGTATMAKLPSFADVAGGVERVGRGLQDGALQWQPALRGALTAAVDDLKTLIHSARKWSPAEDQRARTRSEELARFAPAGGTGAPRAQTAQKAAAAGSAFLAAEASNIAAGLELLNTRDGAADTASNLLRRVRALRGVAGVKEVTPLADVLEATEDAARGLELGDTVLTPEARQLFETAAVYLREVSTALRYETDVNAPSTARDAFFSAQDRWAGRAGQGDQVVPITSLFYGDGGPGVVDPALNPPTSASARFRLELVSHGEHLRQVTDAARRAGDQTSVDRARRDLKRAFRALASTADSFGERTVAEAIRARTASVESLDTATLDSLDGLASVLSKPSADSAQLVAELSASRSPDERAADLPAAKEVVAPVSEPEPAEPESAEPGSAPVTHHRRTPIENMIASAAETVKAAAENVTSAAATLIDSSLAALEGLTAEPWLSPVEIPEEAVVPIETLLYRGKAALDRAVEIRDEARRTGTRIDDETLDELFDLVELARTE